MTEISRTSVGCGVCGNTIFPHACYGGRTVGPNIGGNVNVQIRQHQCGSDCPNHRTAQIGSADPLELADRLEQIANVGLVWELHDEDALRASARVIRELHGLIGDMFDHADMDAMQFQINVEVGRATRAEALADRLRVALRDYAGKLHTFGEHGGPENWHVAFPMTHGGDPTLPLCEHSDCVGARELLSDTSPQTGER